MKLSWGQPFWAGAGGPELKCARLDRDVRCDVVVVGAGATGAMIADALTRAGLDVVCVDKRRPGCGSTGASTSLLLYELDTPLSRLANRVGLDGARRAYRLGVEAIERLEALATELGTDCGFARRKSVYLCSEEKDLAGLKEECEARENAGLRVEFLGHDDLRSTFGFRKPGAILSHDAAEVDPLRLTRLVLQRCVARGLRLYCDCEVTSVRPGDHCVRADVAHGPAITAAHVVYATGYEAAPYLNRRLAQPQITYAAVSEPVAGFPDWWERALIWETARPYLYLRTTPDNRVMIGGLDDEGLAYLGDVGRVKRKAAKLGELFAKLFPRVRFECAGAWAGVFETTSDGLPYIGRHPDFPRTLFGLGYGGNGLTFSVIAPGIIRDLCLGTPNADAELFGFQRALPKTLR